MNPSDLKIELCRNCINRQFSDQVGIVCGLTSEKPTFIGFCEDFKFDNTTKAPDEIAESPNAFFRVGLKLVGFYFLVNLIRNIAGWLGIYFSSIQTENLFINADSKRYLFYLLFEIINAAVVYLLLFKTDSVLEYFDKSKYKKSHAFSLNADQIVSIVIFCYGALLIIETVLQIPSLGYTIYKADFNWKFTDLSNPTIKFFVGLALVSIGNNKWFPRPNRP